MDKTMLALLIITALILGTIIYYNFVLDKPIIKTPTEESNVYQGPVPEGYNETHFRQTGETIPLIDGEELN